MKEINVKEIRKKLGLTQAQLAKKLGVDTKTIQNWEYGKTVPSSKYGILRELQAETETEDNNANVTQTSTGNNSHNINGNSNLVVDTATFQKTLDEISEMRSALTDALKREQETNRRLMDLLEKLNNKDK